MYSHGPKSALESETFGQDLSFHIEQPVGSMSISPCGRDVVLASKEGLHIIDLDSPYSPPRYLPHRTAWEVADVQWSPFAARDYWVISTSNQKALVWNLGMKSWQDSVEFILHGHTRAITDINFSAHHPDVLATCAVDSFVHCWDLRVPARPIISFSDWFAGATQVKWSRQVSHVVASSHDKYLRIWDDRMGACPVRSIEAHNAKIYGIDWNRHDQSRIVTCSLDKSIKFWDFNNLEDVPERVINTSFPAWRARHTPFGWGLLAMPQRGNSDLHLYDRRPTDGQCISGAVPAVARFDGHKGQVREFLWRPRGTIVDNIDHREFQLVSWGTDQELRLHRMVPETLSAVGYEMGVIHTRVNLTRGGAKYKTFRDEPSEELFTDVFESHTGSSPAAGQSFPSRIRGSTSVGMSKVALPQPQGWLQGSSVTARFVMHGKAGTRRIMNPIDWMKNVKITSWTPETLGEEIAQVGEKFAKLAVAFESVDVSQRKAVISMHAPWGNSDALIFMRFDIKFPIAYPLEAAAIFSIQKTAAVTDELVGILSTELRTIAQTYLARKRGCLEAALRYLLRKQDMEQIVSWILDESLEDSKLADDVGFEEEISSDEDDVGGTTYQGQSGTTNLSELINAHVPVPVPKDCGAIWADNGHLICFFPRKPNQPSSFLDTLGLRTNDSDKSENIFEGFGRFKTDSPGARTTRRTVTTGDDETSNFSDDSSFSSPSSSSSSSGSSDDLASLPTHFFPRTAWRPGGIPRERSRSADHSSQSAIGLSRARFGGESSDNVISIHDFSELIPSKRELAMKYLVFGKGSDMCDYNADVAISQGHEDIGHIWRLIKLMLQEKIPLESISNIHGPPDILTIARSALDNVMSNDSGVDLSYDRVLKRTESATTGRVRWGESAVGGKYLVPALINYFEALGDVQMLAMLTCVLAEPKSWNSSAALPQYYHQHISKQLKAPAFSVDYHPSREVARSIADKATTTSFASANATADLSDRDHLNSTQKTSNSNPTTPYSAGTTPPNLSHQLSQRPSHRRRSSRPTSVDLREHGHSDSASTAHSGPISLSTSPEATRSGHRSNSNLAFSLSRASLSALTPSYSHSPPTVSSGSAGHKKSSPVGSLMAHHVNAGGWSAANIFGGPSSGRSKPDMGFQKPRPGRRLTHLAPSSSTLAQSHSMSSDGDVIEQFRKGSTSHPNSKPLDAVRHPSQSILRKATKRKIRIRSALHNQNMFDEEGYASVPLLDPSFEWKYRAYRMSYAHLLGVWGLHSQRAEVLKFDGPLGHFAPIRKDAEMDCSTGGDELTLGNLLRRKALHVTRANLLPQRGLEIRRQCHRCGRLLVAIEKNGIPIGWQCTTCAQTETKSSTRTICAICTESIVGIMVPCLNCGHVTCFECHRTWLGRDNNIHTTDDDTFDPLEAGDKPCPTGCDCICSSHQFATVPYPPPSEDEDQPPEENDHPSYRPAPSPFTAHDLLSTHGPDTAIRAFLSLSRVRSASSSTKGASDRGGKKVFTDPSATTVQAGNGDAASVTAGEAAYTDAWARYANMGKGLGAGLTRSTTGSTMGTAMRTRTLREMGGERTVRRDSEAEARLRRVGSMHD